MKIENNKVVSFHYTLTLNSGEEIDSSEGKDPLSIIVGAQQIIPGLEKELIGMKVGDKKKIVVQPEDGYGIKKDELIHVVNKDQVPNAAEMKVGETLRAQGDGGEMFEGVILESDDQNLKVDFNHPLAGQELSFDTEIVIVRDATNEEMDHGHVH
jgi:FKBP-type peptidyl-prolyl cis-trans isomerase SlyD